MGKHDDAERVEFATRQGWRDWLAANHATSTGVFVVYFKKSAMRSGPTYDDLVEEALCFGWVDGTARSVDADRTSLWFCPRRRGSTWAATNKVRVENLRSAGLMHPAGEAAIERAKSEGSWSALDRSDSLEPPPELVTALAAHPGAREAFDALTRGRRRECIYRVDSAKRPETRQRRAEQVALELIA